MRTKELFTLLCIALMLLPSCKEEPGGSLSKTSYTMYADDEAEIQGENLSGIVWESKNDFVAQVKNNSTIKGLFVGTTTITSNTGLSIKVQVKPRYNTYKEPINDWGISKSALISKYGTPANESNGFIIFKTGNAAVPLIFYSLENGVVEASGVVCPISSFYAVTEFLTERYLTVNINISKYEFTMTHCSGKKDNPTKHMFIQAGYSSSLGGVMVVYMPAATLESRSDGIRNLNRNAECLWNKIDSDMSGFPEVDMRLSMYSK